MDTNIFGHSVKELRDAASALCKCPMFVQLNLHISSVLSVINEMLLLSIQTRWFCVLLYAELITLQFSVIQE